MVIFETLRSVPLSQQVEMPKDGEKSIDHMDLNGIELSELESESSYSLIKEETHIWEGIKFLKPKRDDDDDKKKRSNYLKQNDEIKRRHSHKEEEDLNPGDQLILETLRGVVRSCTNSDSAKRPTASQIHELLSQHLSKIQTSNYGEFS